jgi:hypothetical protein
MAQDYMPVPRRPPGREKELLTSEERYVVGIILVKVKSAMVWDATLLAYTDNEGIILNLDKNEMAALTRAIKKI